MMTFEDVLNQAVALLRRQKRVSYRALKRQFDIDDDFVADLKAEIVDVLELAVDQEGKVLVWAGETGGTAKAGSPAAPAAPLLVS